MDEPTQSLRRSAIYSTAAASPRLLFRIPFRSGSAIRARKEPGERVVLASGSSVSTAHWSTRTAKAWRRGATTPAVRAHGGMLDIVVADDPERAFNMILPHFLHQSNTYAECAVAGSTNAPRQLSANNVLARRTGPSSVRGLRVLTPDDAVSAIHHATFGAPVEHAFLWNSVAAMPDEISDRHVELLCTRVAPALETLRSEAPGP